MSELNFESYQIPLHVFIFILLSEETVSPQLVSGASCCAVTQETSCTSALFTVATNGTKRPAYSLDGNRFPGTCPESRAMATVSPV